MTLSLANSARSDAADADVLVSPRELRAAFPVSAVASETVTDGRDQLRRILAGHDDRLAVVVGPCSVHDRVAALDYARRLRALADEAGDRVQLVMRVYFEKPRTTIGWKGLLSDPHLDGSHDLDAGLRAARRLLVDIADLGVPTATEFLDPMTAGHLSDVVTYGAIGARTAASQVHRQLVSGLGMPVGIKNATDGDVQIAVDAVRSASSPHVFPGVDDDGRLALVRTAGNLDAHVILRGGARGPNYDAGSVADCLDRAERSGAPRRVVVDASHGNSAKDHRRQVGVLTDLAGRIASGEAGIVGVMAESFLVEGRQDLTDEGPAALTYGRSITDACLGWDETVGVVRTLAEAISARRAGGTAR